MELITPLKPIVKIMMGGREVLVPNDRLISFSLTDQSGLESDSLSLTLDQRGWKIARPRKGVKIDVLLGYRETGLKHMGRFGVDETAIEFMPATLTIEAKAAAMQGGLKNQRKKSYHENSLGEIIEDVAARHGLSPAISEDLKNKAIAHIDQFNESDLHFLTRLAKRYGAIFTIKNDKLLFIYRGEGKTASGLDLPVLELAFGDISGGGHKTADRAKYDKVIAEYHDYQTGKRTQAVAEAESDMGGSKAEHRIRTLFSSKEEAQDAANAMMRNSLMDDGELSFDMAGRTDLMAETIIKLKDDWPPELEGSLWVIAKADHAVSGSYEVSIMAKTPVAYVAEMREKQKKEKQEKAQKKQSNNSARNGNNQNRNQTTQATAESPKPNGSMDFSKGYEFPNMK